MAEYIIDENGKKVYPVDYGDGVIAYYDEPPDSPVSRNTGGPSNKPDGTPIDPISVQPSNAKQGSATKQLFSTIGNALLPGAGAIFNIKDQGKITQDPTKTGLAQILEPISNSPNDPPYDNLLEDFASFNALWTMACLEPNQFNSPASYRNSPASIRNIVFSSAGRFEEGRIATVNGVPEFFLDNFNLAALVTPVSSGNTNVVTISFEVYEPYSMGLFLQSMQGAAISAGYASYLGKVPFLMKLDFIGNTDDGALTNTVTAFSRFFTVQITNVTQQVNESGSRYTVSAIPFHHLAYADSFDTVKQDVKLIGGNVGEVLSSGAESFMKWLNDYEQSQVKEGLQSLPDIFEIVFPADESDQIGALVSGSTPFSLGATVNPLASVQQIISNSKGQISSNFGSNSISSSTMNFSAEVGGKYVRPKESEVIDTKTGTADRNKVKIDPKSREFVFANGDRITQIIKKVILVSQYAANALDAENHDSDGMANWFRVDVQVQLLDYDSKRNMRARKNLYRIVPYKVDGSIIKNPSAPSPNLSNRAKKIAKRYDYIYTGINTNILSLNLEFNTMFFTGRSPSALNKTGTNNSDTNNAVDRPSQTAEIAQGGTSAVTGTGGSKTVSADPQIGKAKSPIGDKTIGQQIAEQFQNAFINSSADLVNLEMEILGDPYFLADSGINSNYFAAKGVNSQITADNTLNYEATDIFVYITFRTPIEPNLGTSKEGGLYSFPNNGGISPYSGIYHLTNIENKFANGNFTQNLKMLRVLGQPSDFRGQEKVDIKNFSLFNAPIPVPPQSTPAADPETQRKQEEVDSTFVETEEETERLLAGTDSPTSSGRTITYDVRGVQQEAKITEFNRARAAGFSEREADSRANRVGSTVGAEAIRNLPRF